MDPGTHFDKTELQRLMQEHGVDPIQTEDEQKPVPAKQKVWDVITILVLLAFFAVLLLGRASSRRTSCAA